MGVGESVNGSIGVNGTVIGGVKGLVIGFLVLVCPDWVELRQGSTGRRVPESDVIVDT
jgi:hypothetical protein